MNDQMGGWSVAFCRTWNVTSQFGLGLGMFACSTQITLPLCCWHVFQWGEKKKVDSVNWLSFSIILTFFIAMLQSNPSTLHLFQIFNKIYENYKME